jgi:radical SAM protein with 4Fe4S-binding SPASM domain
LNMLRNAARFYYKALKQPAYALRVLWRRLIGYAFYYLGGGKSSSPEAVTLFLTHKCNLRCKMCGQWGEGGVTKKDSPQHIQEELSRAELGELIDELAISRPNITLFGGEPLLYPGVTELIGMIKQKGLHCLMITNGSLLEKVAEEIVDSGLDELNLSLDGKAEEHDRIRGLPGLFDRIMAGLQKINHYKEKKSRKYPLINLQCTINRDNYRHLEQLLEVAAAAKVNSLTFHNLIFLDPSIIQEQKKYDRELGCDSSAWEGFVFEPGMEPEALFQEIARIKSGTYPFSVDFYPNFSREEFLDYYRNKNYRPAGGSSRCLSPWIVAYIFPDGAVRPCLNFNYSYGNIKSSRFRDIWNSPRAVKYRLALKKNKLFPVCSRCTELYRY